MKINKTFFVKPEEESSLIAEAFWIEDKYDNKILDLELPETLPQITYITGDSWCWKSSLLKALNKEESVIQIQENKILCKWWEKYWLKEEETLQYLSIVGLSDAVLFLSKYEHLSDSQKYRAKIADFFMRGDSEIILDEFLSTLDRTTAKAVSFCIQKACRKLNRKIVCVTAHSDLENYLLPDLIIKGKAFPSRWEVYSKENKENNKPFEDEIIIKQVDKIYYRNCKLANLHYKWKYTWWVKEIFSMELEGETIWILLTIYEKVNNKEWRKISRVVIHPSFRWIWLGALFVKFVLNYCKDKNMDVTAISAMAKFNPFFEKAGMIRLKDSEYKPKGKFIEWLVKLWFDIKQWYKRSYCEKFCENLDNRFYVTNLSKDVNKFVNVWGVHISDEEVKEKIMKFVSTAGRVLWFVRPKSYAKYKFENK